MCCRATKFVHCKNWACTLWSLHDTIRAYAPQGETSRAVPETWHSDINIFLKKRVSKPNWTPVLLRNNFDFTNPLKGSWGPPGVPAPHFESYGIRSCESPDILLFPSLLNKWPSYARHWTGLDYWSLVLTPEPVCLTVKPLLQVLQTLREPVCVLRCFSCVRLWDLMDHSPSGSSVHGILQARILAWVTMPCSRGSSQPRDGTRLSYVSCIGDVMQKDVCIKIN